MANLEETKVIIEDLKKAVECESPECKITVLRKVFSGDQINHQLNYVIYKKISELESVLSVQEEQ